MDNSLYYGWWRRIWFWLLRCLQRTTGRMASRNGWGDAMGHLKDMTDKELKDLLYELTHERYDARLRKKVLEEMQRRWLLQWKQLTSKEKNM